MRKTTGMLLTTGPTGSGKSTTLYTLLDILNTPNVNISTIEDPIEYRLSGVVQAQVTPGIALRAGRMGAPFFAVSDFRDVGFANVALRPPTDVYNQVPVSHFDGADASYQTNTSIGTVTGQLEGSGYPRPTET